MLAKAQPQHEDQERVAHGSTYRDHPGEVVMRPPHEEVGRCGFVPFRPHS